MSERGVRTVLGMRSRATRALALALMATTALGGVALLPAPAVAKGRTKPPAPEASAPTYDPAPTAGQLAGTLREIEAALTSASGPLTVWDLVPLSTTYAQLAPGQASGSDEITLAPITVEGGRRASPTRELGLPPEPYAGGQVARGASLGVLGTNDVFRTPFSIKSLTAEGLQDRQVRTLSDAIDVDPAVITIGRGNSFEYLTIRGFGFFTNYNDYYDGIRLALAAPKVPELYERIHILKGPSALIFGGLGSVGGLINFVPKRPLENPLTSVTLSASSRAQGRAHVDVSRRFGPSNEWGIRLNAVGNLGQTTLPEQDRNLGALAGALEYRGDRFRTSLVTDYQREDFLGNDGGTFNGYFTGPGRPPRASLYPFAYGAPWSYVKFEGARALLNAEYDVTDNVTVYAKGGVQKTETYVFRRGRCTFGLSGACTVTPIIYDEPSRVTWNIDTGIRMAVDTGPIKHRLSVDYSYNQLTLSNADFIGFAPQPFNIFTVPRVPFPTRVTSRSKSGEDANVQSVSITDIASMFDDRLILNVGGRYVSIDTANLTNGAVSSSFKEEAFTPAIGALFRLTPTFAIYGNYIKSLETGPTAPLTAQNRGQSLAPLEAQQFEVGAKWDLGTFGITAALFDIERPFAFTNEANVFGYNGLQRNRGLEVDFFGEPLDGVRLIGGFTLLDAKLEKTLNRAQDGFTPPGVPDLISKLGAEWDLPFAPGLTLTGLAIHTSSQISNTANTQKLAPWTRFDVGLRYKVNDTLTLRALVQNVLDREYFESVDRGLYYNLGERRNFRVSAQATF